jgi:hypothetical protein
MNHSSLHLARLALHQLLGLCREALKVNSQEEVRAWLRTVELHAWETLGQPSAQPDEQARLLANCERLAELIRQLIENSSIDSGRRSAA